MVGIKPRPNPVASDGPEPAKPSPGGRFMLARVYALSHPQGIFCGTVRTLRLDNSPHSHSKSQFSSNPTLGRMLFPLCVITSSPDTHGACSWWISGCHQVKPAPRAAPCLPVDRQHRGRDPKGGWLAKQERQLVSLGAEWERGGRGSIMTLESYRVSCWGSSVPSLSSPSAPNTFPAVIRRLLL